VIKRFDDDNAVAADERPGAVVLFADEVEIVRDLCRLGMPLLARRRGRRRGVSRPGSRPPGPSGVNVMFRVCPSEIRTGI
jgi:hypothetical protein